jgi:putative ABC transport system ATP-binding protein
MAEPLPERFGQTRAATKGGAAGEASVVSVRNVSYSFGADESRKQVLFDTHLDVFPGEIGIITGPSGSGKTTLLTLIGALRVVQDGSINVMGQELRNRRPAELVAIRRRIGFIFQAHNLFEALTASLNVQVALKFADLGQDERERKAAALLTQLGLEHRIHYKPRALSGGQQQKVAIARALVARPKLILADEPTAALDQDSTREVIRLLRSVVVEERSSVLLVTHDGRVLESADRIVNMVDGRIVSDVVVRESVAICRFLSEAAAFTPLGPIVLAEVAARMTFETRGAGTDIVRQGDPGDKFYVIRRGSVDVRVAGRDMVRTVARLGDSDVFGGTALLTDLPHDATIVAREPLELYVLGKTDFRGVVARVPSFKEHLLKAHSPSASANRSES